MQIVFALVLGILISSLGTLGCLQSAMSARHVTAPMQINDWFVWAELVGMIVGGAWLTVLAGVGAQTLDAEKALKNRADKIVEE